MSLRCNPSLVTISALAQHCRQLQVLSVDLRFDVTDSSVSQLASNCADLRKLVFRSFVTDPSSLTDAAIAAVARNCTRLEELVLTDRGVGDASG
jgi:predicted nucleic acid-binding protein